MQTILDEKFSTERSVVALGMFDGVHIGHRVLLQRAASLAHQRHVPLVVCTFQTHPLQVIAPDKCPPMLSTFEERRLMMEELGVDVLCAMPFTPEVMNMPPEDYVGHLVRRFHPTDVVCGYNHTFGKKGQGTPALLSALGAALGFETSIVPNITLDGREVSSTAIRRALASGKAGEARQLLARPYQLDARLESRKNGRCCLRFSAQGKQQLPEGNYRVFVSDEVHAYPALMQITEENKAVCFLPSAAALGDQLCVQLWREA